MNCRICQGKNLIPYLDLGFTPPADQFLRPDQMHEAQIYYPLVVLLCEGCGLSQLSHVVSPEILYRRDYPYESSLTATGQRHWSEFARTTVERLQLGPKDLVIDVGSNVGVLLGAFKSLGTQTLGVDPAQNIVRIAESRGIETVCDFFGSDVARRIVTSKGQATVITGTNVFAHADNLDDFVSAADLLLNDRGVLIIEAPYFVNLVKSLEYDTIYHEHLSYLSLKPLIHLFGRFNMEVFDVEERDIHGGSFRIYVTRAGRRPVAPIIRDMVERERALGIHSLPVLNEFSKAVEKNREELTWLLKSFKREGKRIAGVSAPAKGMTLLNYCRIGRETLDYVTEKSTLKIGRVTPGLQIPVVPDQKLIQDAPDYALLLAWNFAKEIMGNLAEYRKRGGKFIIPIPKPHIVD